ncbi:hypothetical protein F4678DRAFT_459979 [Xylaria arbuscula]|nr:hypothetical protein F4678DRAFT_459979 [Xylaria arbuscula]
MFIVDFECIRSEDGPLPLQVAIFDAAERQVVPATLYGAFFPEDRRLTLDAHDAGVDVTITIQLVKAYLLRAFGMPLPGKIDSHFSSADRGAKGWELDAEKLLGLLEKATPAISLSEVVDDNEISQSGIDKLLDDHDESLEDIPDDESAGDLSIRLEQKNLLDDLMDY